MQIVDEISDWVRSKTKIFESLNFFNSFTKVDDTKGIDEKELIFYMGNSEIRLSKDNIEIGHGIYSNTKIVVEKNKIYFKFQDSGIVDLEDIKKVLDYFYGGTIEAQTFEAIFPLFYDGEFLSISTANAFQAGALNPSDWIAFNAKQNGSLELTNLSQISGNGLVYRDSTGVYTTTSLTLGTMSNQNANNVGISGGSINNTPIGVPTPELAHFTKITIYPPTTNDIPIVINALNSGADTIRVVREDGSTGFKLLNSGSMEVSTGSFYRHSGNQVVGGRRTGWSGQNWGTITQKRSLPANTAAPTTVELMQIISAILSDLGSTNGHGLIDR